MWKSLRVSYIQVMGTCAVSVAKIVLSAYARQSTLGGYYRATCRVNMRAHLRPSSGCKIQVFPGNVNPQLGRNDCYLEGAE
jgi:hypothetical protein